MRLFDVPKVGLFLDTVTHGTETRAGEAVKVVTLTLRAASLSPQLASACPGRVRSTLFTRTAAARRADLRRVEFDFAFPRQRLDVYATPDTADPSIAFDQVAIVKLWARVDKDDSAWALLVKAQFGPLSRVELEYLEAWRLGERWITCAIAETALFDLVAVDAPVVEEPLLFGADQ